VPAPQGEQVLAAAAEYAPGLHDAQLGCADDDWVPAAQAEHVAAAAPEYVPAPHDVHRDWPGRDCTVPAVHSSQLFATEVVENLPASQSVHSPCSEKYWPVLQPTRQEDAPEREVDG